MHSRAIKILKENLNNKEYEFNNHLKYYEATKEIKSTHPEIEEKIVGHLKRDIEEIKNSISYLENIGTQ